MATKSASEISLLLLCWILLLGTTKVSSQVTIDPSEEQKVFEPNGNYTLDCYGDEPVEWITPKVNQISATNFAVKEISNPLYVYGRQLYIENLTFPYTGEYVCKGLNTKSKATIYVYVNDRENLIVNNQDDIEIIKQKLYKNVIIPCKPTSPEVQVELSNLDDETIKGNFTFDPTEGFRLYIFSKVQEGFYHCIFTRDDVEMTILYNIEVEDSTIFPHPLLSDESRGHTEIGQTLTLKCSINETNVNFNWILPSGHFDSSRMTIKNFGNYEILVINNIKKSDGGTYTCGASNHDRSEYTLSSENITVNEKGYHFLEILEDNIVSYINVNASIDSVKWRITILGHPVPKIDWINNEGKKILLGETEKYTFELQGDDAFLVIKNPTLNDTGNYTLRAYNGMDLRIMPLYLNVTDKPLVRIDMDKYHVVNQTSKSTCVVQANPPPQIFWEYKECEQCKYRRVDESFRKQNKLQYESIVELNTIDSGYLKCSAYNVLGTDLFESKYYVSDVKNGFGIFGLDKTINFDGYTAEIARGETLTMTCGAAIDDYMIVDWYANNNLIQKTDKISISGISSKYSRQKTITITNVDYTDNGPYVCKATTNTSQQKNKSIKIKVSNPKAPTCEASSENLEINMPERVTIACNISGVPRPSITWYKNEELFIPTDDRIIVEDSNKKIIFTKTELVDEAEYKCKAENKIGVSERNISIMIKNKPGNKQLVYVTFVIVPAFIIAVLLLIYYIRKQKKLQKELKLAGLANFEKGAVENLNPELGIDEQADLLPYDRKWEFSYDKLKLGKQLGSGEFGVVLKAVAKGILPDEEETIVAVKMVKKNASAPYIRALASELKVMVHLGQHLNVVNLLGACTHNVAKRELCVIVEYCRFGNLHNYIYRHRNNFINQIDYHSGELDFTIGLERLNRSYSIYSNKTTRNSSQPIPSNMEDYRQNDPNYNQSININTGGTEMTSVSDSSSSGGYVSRYPRQDSIQPEWRSNYKGDYKENSVRPICTKDLLAWAFQVTRGMEYLASRKILHGDLAARNILLTDNNIVKICDFGLAKNMYKSGAYTKKSDSPLPIKWMAIESIRDKVFSTQSDIWSFGIVLWEFFSLAMTPYPGMKPDEEFYRKLVSGYKMECPEFAPKEMYTMMLDCWNAKPLERPSFTKLSEQIGVLMEEGVRQYYIDLNNPYQEMNTQRLKECDNDFLSMLNAPDFENLSSPNYLNETTEGYLTMTPQSIFSPRIANSPTFDFNIPNGSASGTTVELQPMLQSIAESEYETPLQSPSLPTNSVSNPSYVLHNDAMLIGRNSIRNYVNMEPNGGVRNSTQQNEEHPYYINAPKD